MTPGSRFMRASPPVLYPSRVQREFAPGQAPAGGLSGKTRVGVNGNSGRRGSTPRRVKLGLCRWQATQNCVERRGRIEGTGWLRTLPYRLRRGARCVTCGSVGGLSRKHTSRSAVDVWEAPPEPIGQRPSRRVVGGGLEEWDRRKWCEVGLRDQTVGTRDQTVGTRDQTVGTRDQTSEFRPTAGQPPDTAGQSQVDPPG